MDKEIKNCLQYYIDLLRGKNWTITHKELNNIISTMRIARHNKICGEDFSQIDWGIFSFNGIHFSDNGKKSSKFNNGIIRNQSIFYGHFGKIFFVQWSDDEKYIATWGFDGKIIIWNIETKSIKEEIIAYEPISPHNDWRHMNNYPNFIFDLIIGITEKYLNKYITIKKAPIISRFLKIYGHLCESCEEHGIRCGNLCEMHGIEGYDICYLTDDKVYAIVESSYVNTPYQIVNLKNLETISKKCNYISISKDGKQYIAVDDLWNVKVFDLKSNKLIMNIMSHMREIDSVGFLSDNTHYYSSCYNGQSLIIWDLKQQRMVKKLFDSEYNIYKEIRRISKIFPKIHNTEYIGYEDYDWNRYEGIKYISNNNIFEIFCIGEEGELSYDTNAYINHQTNEKIYIRDYIRTATLSINEDYFIYFTGSSVVFWEISTQSEKKRIPVICCNLENSYITSSCFSPDGTVLLIGFANGAVHAVDGKTGETICRMEHLAFLFVDGCNFKNTLMDEKVKQVLYSHGGLFD